MVARAASVSATRERILDAAVAAFWDDPSQLPSLEQVAGRAGVSVPTVLRHFGTKDGLAAAAMDRETARVRDQRDPAKVGDVAGAVAQLVEHYEELGDRVVRMLAEEVRHPGPGGIAQPGRQLHVQWCTEVFARHLEGLTGADRERRLAQLVAICDVYTWKLLRRDSGLDRQQTQIALLEMLEPFLKE